MAAVAASANGGDAAQDGLERDRLEQVVGQDDGPELVGRTRKKV